MKAKRRILLCGNSIIMGTIGASLRRCSKFEIITLVSELWEVPEINALKPDMVLFDLESIHKENIFSLLRTNPNLVLLGISPDVNMVKIWSGRQLRELSTQELVEVINGELNNVSVDHKKPDTTPGDLSTANEDTRALLDAFRSCRVPVRISSDNEESEMIGNAATAEERSHITKSEARKVARTLRDVLKDRKAVSPPETGSMKDE